MSANPMGAKPARTGGSRQRSEMPGNGAIGGRRRTRPVPAALDPSTAGLGQWPAEWMDFISLTGSRRSGILHCGRLSVEAGDKMRALGGGVILD